MLCIYFNQFGQYHSQSRPEYVVKPPPPPPVASSSDSAPAPFKMPPCTSKLFHFSKANLAKLKEDASAGLPEGSFLSTNDVVCALMFQAITRARGVADASKVSTVYAADGRQRLSPPLPKGFFGNANFFGHVSVSAGLIDLFLKSH